MREEVLLWKNKVLPRIPTMYAANIRIKFSCSLKIFSSSVSRYTLEVEIVRLFFFLLQSLSNSRVRSSRSQRTIYNRIHSSFTKSCIGIT